MGIFGKDRTKVIEGGLKLVSNVTSMIDDSALTEQEKAGAVGQFVKDTLSENTARSKTRRSVALDTVRFFYALIVFLIISWKFDTLWFDAVKDLIIEFKLPVAFIMIMAFFFSGYYVSEGIKGWKQEKREARLERKQLKQNK
jgi:hypothetical protein